MQPIQMKRALISVSNKEGIADFATSLASHGIEIISTGGTAKVLKDAGLEVTDVSSITGYPEMLDGRVKTLHPVVHGGLLGVRDEPSHVSAMIEHDIQPIDLICIDLYPFEKTIATKDVSNAEVIEQIDIGGPAMIRSAAKNHKFVTVITSPTQYGRVLDEINSTDGATSFELRADLAKDAFQRTASYDSIIANWMSKNTKSNSNTLHIQSPLVQMLRYGENPDQSAAMYSDTSFRGPSVVSAKSVAGKPLSYNNLMDAAAALELVLDLHQATNLPSAAIIKHANPCGASVAETLQEAFTNAWKCDPLAAFGGIVSLSGEVDKDLAEVITEGEKFLEVIVAPSFTIDALSTLRARWKNIRVLEVGTQKRQNSWHQLRSIEGGYLVQELNPIQADSSTWEHVAGPEPIKQQLHNATLAWIACSYLKSNSISIVEKQSLIGGGMGQVDRVSAARLAIQRAGERLTQSEYPVAGSDAFFPFPDAPQMLIDAGVTCIVQPGGSVRDQETIDVCNANNVTLLHTGTRRFRH